MKVAIVKYNAGNIYSVVNALKRLGVDPILTDSPQQLASADRVLFPGQGEARQAMDYLRQHGLDQVIKNLRQPVLGICIGQQLMCRHSEENDTDCLGIFPVDVLRFRPQQHSDKVPHMGWNEIQALHEDEFPFTSNGILHGFDTCHTPLAASADLSDAQQAQQKPFVYFVHSFYVPVCEFTTAVTDYIVPFSAALHKDNFYATQFHPEKSGKVGETILKNFLEL